MNKKLKMLLLAGMTIALPLSPVFAEEDGNDEGEETSAANTAENKLLSLAKGRISGVTEVRQNDDGSIRSLLIVGRAACDRSMDADDAEEDAREEAQINATEAFAQYLNQNVDVAQYRSTSTSKAAAGLADGGEQGMSSKRSVKMSKKSKEYASFSKAAIAGMKSIHEGVYDNKYVIVYAWDKAEVNAIKDVILTMSETAQTAVKEAKDLESRRIQAPGTVQESVKNRDGGSSSSSSSRKKNRKVKEGGNSSSDAGKYF